MSGMTKQNTEFLFFIPECRLFLFKVSANERNDKTKYGVFVFHSREQLILFKDSANERNDKTKYGVFVFHSQVPPVLFKDSANERNDKTEAELIENFTPEEKKQMDIFDTTIRLSMGLEDVNDLFEDIKQALDK